MQRNTGDGSHGVAYHIAVVTGIGLMWAAFFLATLDVCFLLVEVLRP